MSVKLLDNEAFYGYRVRRTVDARLYQEYFSLKKNGKRLRGEARKRIESAADRRDRELARAQLKAKQENKADRCFNSDGSVRGISYLIKNEKSGTRTPIFQVGIASELDGKIICTSYSINAHGEEQAWRMAVRTFAEHKGIGKNSRLYAQLVDARPRLLKARRKLQDKKTRRKSVKHAVKKAVAKVGKRSAKKSVKKAASKAANKAVRHAGKKTAKKTLKKAANKAAKKAARKAAR